MPESTPPWELTGDVVARLRAELATADPDTRADFDAFARFVAEQLGAYRVDLGDEWAVYHGLAFVSLMTELARNNYENGAIDHATAGALTAVARGVAAVLADRAPGPGGPGGPDEAPHAGAGDGSVDDGAPAGADIDPGGAGPVGA
ncbi:MAG TPA: hypothetical protein VK866_03640 [Acidimicrobiales bacterium]|nr:hypothetical protein [Acidimicrobiales bacterium]